MPKRVGNLYEKFLAEENCVLAERNMAKNKPDNRMAKHIGAHAEKYGKALHEMLMQEAWVPSPSRETDIRDNYKGKTRHLEIPVLLDQSVQYAWLNVATPYIERRNYFYNCGSIPGAGQHRAVEGLKRWLGKKKPPKYGFSTDIRHFYETCPHAAVMAGLRRIFKDERFLRIAATILSSMGKNGVGLAIGHPTSHWFANVALMQLDHALAARFPDVKFTRYMDDVRAVSNNRCHLWKALRFLQEGVEKLGMKIKSDWQLFPIRKRSIPFLSYRFSPECTVLVKRLMFRIARKMKRAAGRLNAHTAASVLSYMGILKHCNSYNFREKRVYPYVNIKTCKEVISNASKNRIRPETGAGGGSPWCDVRHCIPAG